MTCNLARPVLERSSKDDRRKSRPLPAPSSLCAERPEWVHFQCRTFTDFYLVISDLGSQRDPLMSLGMFRQFVAPYLKEMVKRIHSPGGKALFHSCGLVRPFIPDLISLGVGVLDSIQPTGPVQRWASIW